MEERKQICCICGRVFSGWGNNPYPLAESGSCCDTCNDRYVIPARLIRRMTDRTPTIDEIKKWMRGE